MVTLLDVIARLQHGNFADKVYVAKEYTVADLIRDLQSIANEHDRRVSELLEANTREVERRREAEIMASLEEDQRLYGRG